MFKSFTLFFLNNGGGGFSAIITGEGSFARFSAELLVGMIFDDFIIAVVFAPAFCFGDSFGGIFHSS